MMMDGMSEKGNQTETRGPGWGRGQPHGAEEWGQVLSAPVLAVCLPFLPLPSFLE